MQNLEFWTSEASPSVTHRQNYLAQAPKLFVPSVNEFHQQRYERGRLASDIAQQSSRKTAELRFRANIAYNSQKGAVNWNPATFETENQSRKLWVPMPSSPDCRQQSGLDSAAHHSMLNRIDLPGHFYKADPGHSRQAPKREGLLQFHVRQSEQPGLRFPRRDIG